MAHYSSFSDLEIFKLSRELCITIWELFKTTPLGGDYELRNQLNRSSGSIMDNIAEGFGRGGNKEFINFLSYSRGSCAETQSQLMRAYDRGHISVEEFKVYEDKIVELENQLSKFINYLKKSDRKGSKFE